MSHHESSASGPNARLVDRMLFFSDAVFAIVLTLLILELRAPDQPLRNTELAAALRELIPSFIAYAASFALVGLYWALHMRMMRQLQVFDWPVAIANLLFLGTIAVFPFSSALLGHQLHSGLAFQVYCYAMMAASGTQFLLQMLILRDGGRLVGGMPLMQRLSATLRALSPGIAFGIGSVMVGAGQPELASWCWVLIFPILFISSLPQMIQKRPAG